MKLLIASILIFALTGCKLFKRKTESVRVENHYFKTDSTHIIERQTLDTFNFPKEGFTDSVGLEILERLGKIKYESGRASTILSYRNGKIHVSTECDSIFQAYVQEQFTKLIRTQSSRSESKEINNTTKEENTNRIRWIVACLLSLFINAIFIFFKIKSWTSLS